MKNDKIHLNISTGGWLISVIIAGIFGYFVYDQSFSAALGVVAMIIVINIVFMLSLIPIIGWVAAVLSCHYYIIPEILEITSLDYTWLITAIFIVAAFTGLLVTIITTFATIAIVAVLK